MLSILVCKKLEISHSNSKISAIVPTWDQKKINFLKKHEIECEISKNQQPRMLGKILPSKNCTTN